MRDGDVRNFGGPVVGKVVGCRVPEMRRGVAAAVKLPRGGEWVSAEEGDILFYAPFSQYFVGWHRVVMAVMLDADVRSRC